MDPDLMFVLGTLFLAGCLASLVSAFSSGSSIRLGVVLGAAGSGLIVLAMSQAPNTYTFESVPTVFRNVIVSLF
ncbi:MAG: hypothetical protein AAFR35_06900 [Pseudomonadota bacterium]